VLSDTAAARALLDDFCITRRSSASRSGVGEFMIASGGVRPHPMLIRRRMLNELAANLLQPHADRSCDGSAGRLRSGAGTDVPLVKPTLRGILPHGSEAPWVPIPLHSSGPARWPWNGICTHARRVGELLSGLRRIHTMTAQPYADADQRGRQTEPDQQKQEQFEWNGRISGHEARIKQGEKCPGQE